MQYTYKLENYYPHEGRAFVVYSSENKPSLGVWIGIPSDASTQVITYLINENAPIIRWNTEFIPNTNVDSFLGIETPTTYIEPLKVIPTEKPIITQFKKVIEGEPELIDGKLYQTWVVLDLVGEELLQAQTQVESQRQANLWYAAHNVEFNAISGSAIGLITMGVLAGKPKCLAVQAWIQTLWTEYYTRKATGSTDYDFTAYSDCPYTVPELMQELSL